MVYEFKNQEHDKYRAVQCFYTIYRSIFVPMCRYSPRENNQKAMIHTKDIINYKALSERMTGSDTKIRRADTAERYKDDVEELVNLIDLWIDWKLAKYAALEKAIAKRRR